MRTYTHGAIGYLLYVRGSRTERRLAAIGALLPDAIVGTGFVFHVAEPFTSLSIVGYLHALLHHSALHTVTIALHSLVLVVPLLVLSAWRRARTTPLLVGMVSHAVVDLLTHRDWAYNHFFPLPVSPIRGLVSYTDLTFTLVEHVALVLFVLWAARRLRSRVALPSGDAVRSPRHVARAEREP